MRASDAVAFAGRCCNYEKCPLRRFTRLSTGPALSLRMEGLAASDLRLCEMAVKQVRDQPLHGTQDDSSHRVVGTERTNKGQRAPFSGGLTPPKATNPITEKERVQASQRDLARRPTASQRAARARAVCSGREDGTASGRGLTRSVPARRCPRAKKRSQDTKGTSTTAHAPPCAARRRRTNGPTPTQPPALPR